MRAILRIATIARLFLCLEKNAESTKINRAGDCTIRIISRRSVSYAPAFRHGSILVLYVSLNRYSPPGVKFQQRFFDEDSILLFYEPNTLTRTLLNLKCNNSCTINFRCLDRLHFFFETVTHSMASQLSNDTENRIIFKVFRLLLYCQAQLETYSVNITKN